MSASGEQITPYLRIVRPLGEGGMGRLWVAEHQTLEIEVAVKLLNPELAQDAQWLARFRHEAQAVAKIDSAHVVRVFDYGTTFQNEPFIMMELLRGEDLLHRIDRSNGLPLEEVELIVSQTCKALGRAHALGIVHRDLKPENIFLTTEGGELFVKLLDFGIAKDQAPKRMNLTDVNSVFGTPLYMSPEQALSASSVDHRADLWALAVVTFQMLTRSCPFVGPTPAAIGMQIQAGEFGLPSELRPGLPGSVDEWFKRALNRDIRARFSSAAQLLAEFRMALRLPGATMSMPSIPGLPPGMQAAPGMPGASMSMPSMPSMPGLPPGMQATAGMPGASMSVPPGMQAMPGMSGMPGVPSPLSDPSVLLGGSAARSGQAVELTSRPNTRKFPGLAATISVVGVLVLGFLMFWGGRFRQGETSSTSPPVATPPSHANAASNGPPVEGAARPETAAMPAEPSVAERDGSTTATQLNPSSPPPAPSAHRAPRGKNALSGTAAANVTTSSTTESKPIKDRGF